MNINRNILILGGLAIATILALLLINYLSPTRRVGPESSELERELTREIEDLESSILELELIYREQGNEIDVMSSLLEIKNGELRQLEQRIDELEAEGRLTRAELERVRGLLGGLDRDADSFEFYVEEARKLTIVRDSLIRITDTLEEQLQELGAEPKVPNVAVTPVEEEDLSPEGLAKKFNLRVFAMDADNNEVEIQRDVDANRIASLNVCFSPKDDVLGGSGTKRIHLQVRNQAGTLVEDKEGRGMTFANVEDKVLKSSASNQVNHRQGQAVRTCVSVAPSSSLFGRYFLELFYDGKSLGVREIYVRPG